MQQTEEKKGFDLEVHKFCPKTGKLLAFQPYSYTISQDEGAWFTRGGVRYNPDGSLKDKPAPVAAKAPDVKRGPHESQKS